MNRRPFDAPKALMARSGRESHDIVRPSAVKLAG